MGLNINTIVPAIAKAKNIATEQYVDTSVASIDVSSSVNSSINANNDTFAQKLGYSNYASMVAAATSGQTLINGGYVNTSLISAGAINAKMINTSGLIAENISANEIVGKTMTGTVINGAAINGAVIKASYLDLDGELEVLTNYHITPAMYNANPSLYRDAVYLSGTNEYRIPSLSTVSEEIRSQNISANGAVFNSKIRSYNCANAGHNMKCVRIQPSIMVSVDVDFFDFNFFYSLPSNAIGVSNTYNLYIASVLVCSIYYRKAGVITSDTGFYINGTKREFSNDIIFNTAGQVIKLSFYNFNTFYNNSEVVSNYNYGIKATIVAGTNTIPLNYNDTSKGLIYIENIGGNTITSVNNYVKVTSKTNTFISINNMI